MLFTLEELFNPGNWSLEDGAYIAKSEFLVFVSYLKRFDNEVEEHEEENKTKAHLMRVVSGRSTKIEMKKSLIERELNEFKSIGLGELTVVLFLHLATCYM